MNLHDSSADEADGSSFGERSQRRPGLGRLAITNFENNKTASIDSQACHGKNDKEESRWCGIELRSARKPASNCELCPKTCVGILGSGWKRCAAACSKLKDKGNRYRLRIGTYRVLFVLAGEMIQFYAVKDRKKAYD